ncbi:hypothetical protein RintRC_3910 [Richelia intracellularis]|nr:hypothetical protein RintRC_3910 [Richelia intracellularis]
MLSLTRSLAPTGFKSSKQKIKGSDSFGSTEYDIRIINDKSTRVVLTAKNVLDGIGL